MDSGKFIEFAKEKVREYAQEYNDERVALEDIYVVWSCKTLQNNKALLSTHIPDGRYYEVTYNGDKKEVYLDCYKKVLNVCYKEIV